jgi:hypothetical protein
MLARTTPLAAGMAATLLALALAGPAAAFNPQPDPPGRAALALTCTGARTLGAVEVDRARDGARVASLSCSPGARVAVGGTTDTSEWVVRLTIGNPDIRPTTCALRVRALPTSLSCAAVGDVENRVAFTAVEDPND